MAAPYGFEITRIGQTKETVPADSMKIESGDAPKYVFRKADKLVREIFVHALEIEPKPLYHQSPEKAARRRESVQRAGAATSTHPDLLR